MGLRYYNPYMGQTIAVNSLKRGFIGHFERTALENSAADTDGILDGTALLTDAQTISVFLKQPTCAKNITVAGMAINMVGDVVVTGTNINGKTIVETFTLNGIASIVGNSAFASITKIDFPALTTAGDTVDIGWGVKLGLPVALKQNTVIKAFRDVSTADSGTVAVSATAVESNTYIVGATAKSLDVWFIIN